MRGYITSAPGNRLKVAGMVLSLQRRIFGLVHCWFGTAFPWYVVLWFCIGVLLARLLDLPPHLMWIVSCLWGLTYCVAVWFRPGCIGRAGLITLVIMVGATSFSVHWFRVEDRHRWLMQVGDETPILARVYGISDPTSLRRTITLELEGLSHPTGLERRGGMARVTQVALSDEELTELRPGQLVLVRAHFRPPRRASNPGQFDYANYLRRRGIGAEAYIEGNSLIQKLEAKELGQFLPKGRLAHYDMRFGLLNRADKVRRAFFDVWQDHLPERLQALLGAMVLGDKRALPRDMQADFGRTGQAHLLSVSGLHVGFVAAGIWLCLRILRVGEPWHSIITILFVWAYALIVGWNLPVIRAATTLTLHLAALCLGRGHDRLAATGWAALIQLVSNPSLLFDTSFQLSYGALLGIVNIGPILTGIWHLFVPSTLSRSVPWKIGCKIVDIVIVSLSAQLVLFPLLVYYFHEFAWVGLFLGIITIPLAGVIVPWSLLASIVGLWGPMAGMLAPIIRLPLEALDMLVGSCAAYPWSCIRLAAGSPVFWLGYYIVLTLVMQKLNQRVLCQWMGMERVGGRRAIRTWPMATAVFLLAVVYYPILAPLWRPLEIVLLDVGQGDAIFIRTPSNRTMLVDGGGRPPSSTTQGFDVGKDIVLPYLRHKGVRKLDVVVATHMHNDHTQGLGSIVEELPVGMLADNGLLDGGFASWQYREALRRANVEERITRQILRRGHFFALDPKVKVEVLYPTGPPNAVVTRQILDQNNNSIVLRLITPHYAVLLTGDIDKAAQHDLLRLSATSRQGQEHGGEPKDPALDSSLSKDGFGLEAHILKVPHHGSRQALSYAFLGAVSPSEAVISLGTNPFGHPSPDYIHALKVVTGKSPWRTDELGSITVSIRGRYLSIRGYHTKPSWSIGTWPTVQRWEDALDKMFAWVRQSLRVRFCRV